MFGLLLHFGLVIYGREVCELLGCTSDLRRFYLEPLREGGLIIAAVGVPFLFISQRYFVAWFFFFFTPLLALDVYGQSQQDKYSNVGITNPSLDPVVLYVILTLSFIIFHYTIIKNTKFKYLYFVLTLAIALCTIVLTNPFLRNGFINNYL